MKIFILLFTIVSFRALACVYSATAFPDNLVSFVGKAKEIYLAKLVSARTLENQYQYNFSISDSLKGDKIDKITVNVDSSLNGYSKVIQDHNMVSFWTAPTKGATKLDPDCKIRPNFNLGYEYLLILSNDKPSVKSYEMISSKDDKWLNFIRSELENKEYVVYNDKDFLSIIKNINIFSCNLAREDIGKRSSKFVKTLIGNKEKEMWPDKITDVCSYFKEGNYAQLSFNNDNIILHVPYKNNRTIDFNKQFPFFDIVQNNQLTIVNK